jgi:ribosome-associated protein
MGELDPLMKAKLIVETALELKAELPIALDMRKLTAFADFFVILTGRSDRQVRSIADTIIQTLKARDEEPLGVEGLDDGKWVLIDCNDAIVHVFDPDTRIKYDLERLWRDAPRIDLGIPGVDPNPEREREQGLDADLEQGGEADADGGDELRSGEGEVGDPAA